MRTAGPAVEELKSELRPRVHPHHQVMIEHRQAGGLEHDPADLRLHVGALLVPAPGADHVAGADQLDTPASQHLDLATDQAIDDEKAPWCASGSSAAVTSQAPVDRWRTLVRVSRRARSRSC